MFTRTNKTRPPTAPPRDCFNLRVWDGNLIHCFCINTLKVSSVDEKSDRKTSIIELRALEA